jgi:ankyrin repeat protein
MQTLKELQESTLNPKRELVFLEDELRLLIQNHQWSLLWNALVVSEFQAFDFGILGQLQKSVRFPESEPANTLRMAQAPDISDYRPGKTIWKNIIIPYLPPRDQLHLSKVSLYFFRLLSDLYELKAEFPAYFFIQLHNGIAIDPQKQLSVLRALAYPEAQHSLRDLFKGVVKNFSPSDFLQMSPAQLLSQWVLEERHTDDGLPIEKLSPFTLSIKLDRLSTVLFFLNHLEHKASQHLDNILKYASQYGAITILQFFLWAFPNNDYLRFDSYFIIACEYSRIHVITLLAPRVHATTLTMCRIIAKNDPMTADVATFLEANGAKISEVILDYRGDAPCYSKLMKDIIHNDLAMNVVLFLKRWPITSLASLFHLICSECYKQENLPLDIIALLLSRSKRIQTQQDAVKSYSKFIHLISNSNRLKSFLTVFLPKWNLRFLPSSRSKIITAVCSTAHIENFRTLLDYGIDINTSYASKKHVLTSPLSRVVFSYSKSKDFFDFLIVNGAAFSHVAACHAVEGGQLGGLKALMRLPDRDIRNDALEYHPLFVAAQFGRLDCFDFLLSQGVTLDTLTTDQLLEFLIQGPIAGLLQLRNACVSTSWLGSLYHMRAQLLTKMISAEIGNKYGFPQANPFEFPGFLKEKSQVYLKIIRLIMPYVKEKIIGNESILFIALSTGNVSLVLLVLNYFPAIDSIDEKGCSSLLIAVQQGNREMVAVLLEFGAVFVIARHRLCPLNAAHKDLEILALLINSKQYTLLNFPNFPNKDQCQSCLPYLTEKYNKSTNPQLAEILYERHRLHQNMTPLQNIQQKISEITSGRGWGEHGFSRIIINNTSYSVPGIIAEIYDHILALYKLPYSEAIMKLPTVYQSIEDLITSSRTFRLRFYSSTTVEICNQIASWIADQAGNYCKISANVSKSFH